MLTNRRNGSPMPTVRLSFSPAPAHVRTARLVAVAVARRAGVAEELLEEIRIAIGEACSRAVALHRTGGGPRAERARAHSAPDRPNVVPVGAATSIWRLRLVERGGRGRADGSGAARRSRRQP